MSESLTDFLLARIAEDEAAAKAGIDAEVESLCGDGLPDMTREDLLTMESDAWRRPLAECEAKRRIVELHEHDLSGKYGSDKPGCWECHQDRDYELIPRGWCGTLRALALPYADHPDYREEWKP